MGRARRRVDAGDAAARFVTPGAALARVARAGDRFAETLTRVQALL